MVISDASDSSEVNTDVISRLGISPLPWLCPDTCGCRCPRTWRWSAGTSNTVRVVRASLCNVQSAAQHAPSPATQETTQHLQMIKLQFTRYPSFTFVFFLLIYYVHFVLLKCRLRSEIIVTIPRYTTEYYPGRLHVPFLLPITTIKRKFPTWFSLP